MTNLRLSSTGLAADLAKLEGEGRSIKVCIIGSGEMGTDLVTAIRQMPGMEIAVIVDRRLVNAPAAIEIAGYDADKGSICTSPEEVSRAYNSQKIPIVADAHMAIGHQLVDVVIDATGRPAAGAEYGLAALELGKHLVMMNVEADVTIGAYLQSVAAEKGLVYTVGAGDEPTV